MAVIKLCYKIILPIQLIFCVYQIFHLTVIWKLSEAIWNNDNCSEMFSGQSSPSLTTYIFLTRQRGTDVGVFCSFQTLQNWFLHSCSYGFYKLHSVLKYKTTQAFRVITECSYSELPYSVSFINNSDFKSFGANKPITFLAHYL